MRRAGRQGARRVAQRIGQRAALLLLLTPGLLVAGAWTAQASDGPTSHVSASAQAWFWKTAYEAANPPVAVAQPPASEPSGVPKGDIAVADAGGTSTKSAALLFDLGSMASGSSVQAFTLALTVDPAGTNADAAGAPVVACPAVRAWQPADGGDYTDAPTVDCTAKVVPKVSGSVYTFDLTGLAQTWVDNAQQNLGLAFVTDPAATGAPFQVVFRGGAAITALATVVPPPTLAAGPATSGRPSTAPVASAGAPAGSAVGTVTVAAAPPVTVPAGSGLARTTTLMATTGQAPATGPAPDVAAQPPARPVALRRSAGASPWPTAPFWLAAAGLALLVGAASLVLGDPTVPVPGAATTRLDRVLRERRTTTTTSLATPGSLTSGVAARGT